VISVTPLSLVTSPWLAGIKFVRSYAYLSYPFYNFTELFKAFFYLNNRDKWSYGRHLLVPEFVWKRLLSKVFQGVIAQSIRTGNRVSRKDNKRIRVHPILPGIDKNIWFPDSRKHRVSEETIFLYTGSPKRIRGFNLILDAFSMLSREKIKLRILARGADQSEVEKIKLRLKQRGLLRHTQVIGGWMSPGQLRQHISNADAVLLPFILVPSELPVTVMEVIACGTPPIVSDIDGLPEAVGDCGMVVPQADAKQLAKAIVKFHKDSRIGEQFRSHCLERYNSMDSWEDTAKKWVKGF
jgi:glycosyltransferase involved in cell wall biosynthesis